MSKISLALFGFGVLLIGISHILQWTWTKSSENTGTNHSKIYEEVLKVHKVQSFYPNSHFLRIYVFNITNIQDVKDGGKPLLEEVGPYVYEIKSFKTDIKLEEKKDSIIYREPVFYYFRSDMTNGSLTDKINTISIPYILLTSEAEKAVGLSGHKLRVHFFWKHPDAEPFDTLTVDEFLFKGKYLAYAENSPDLKGSEIFVNNTFGIYFNKNGTDNGLTEVSTGISDPSETGKIIRWNNSTKLSFWGENEYCNMINGSDGTIFPPYLNKDTILRIFKPTLCRSLPLAYGREDEILGVPGYRYSLSKSFVEEPSVNKENDCFCTSRGEDGNSCPKTGAYQLESCMKGAPLLASLPHFLDGAEEYRKEALGLHPERNMHETFFTVEEKSGIVLESHVRTQMNVGLKSSKRFSKLNNVRNMTLPIYWIDESTEISKMNPILSLMKPRPGETIKQQTAGKIVWLVFIQILGFVLILTGFVKIVYDEWRKRRHQSFKMFSRFRSNTESMTAVATNLE